MSGLELAVVDAFTDRAFAGNPAAVAVVDRFPDVGYMQPVAGEMALSETAFCDVREDGHFDLRWFTPTVEVDLCGHATLATAHVLGGRAAFHARSGLLTCIAGYDGLITMDFPAQPVESIDWWGSRRLLGGPRVHGTPGRAGCARRPGRHRVEGQIRGLA
ncbi:MAG TPA: PhzF family phenazine biosynthesis protein [Acidimicrobiales bacterium]|nr:PhzF family phenazine biosynthesis protein [Acidimicrobiales bacterium]